jgi:hypothetical protein
VLTCSTLSLTYASFYRQQIPSHEAEIRQHAQEFSKSLYTPEDALHLEQTLDSYQETVELITIHFKPSYTIYSYNSQAAPSSAFVARLIATISTSVNVAFQSVEWRTHASSAIYSF